MRWLLLLLTLVVTPALGASRTYALTSFDRIRIDGPFDVRLTVGSTPSGTAEADAETLDDLQFDLQGTTLIVRMGVNGWGEQDKSGGPAPVITITTLALRSAIVIGGGRLRVGGSVRGQRLDLQLTGSGAISAEGLDQDQLYATLLGSGEMRLAGRAARARLSSSGSGTIAAEPLTVSDLTISLDGNGETRATAQYTAGVTSTGLGRVVVSGPASCTVKAVAGGPILCGKSAPPPGTP